MKTPLPDLSDCQGIAIKSGSFGAVYVNPDLATPDIIENIIIHESVHLWQGFAEYLNEDEPSKEFEAYVIAHIAHTLIKEYKRLGAINALHEERKTGLQEGERTVQLPPGTNQSSLGTDDSTETI